MQVIVSLLLLVAVVYFAFQAQSYRRACAEAMAREAQLRDLLGDLIKAQDEAFGPIINHEGNPKC